MKFSEFKKLAKKAGCRKVDEGGRHEIWINPKTGEEMPVSRHQSEEIKPGTLHVLMKWAGLK